jgi:hypothetical protein
MIYGVLELVEGPGRVSIRCGKSLCTLKGRDGEHWIFPFSNIYRNKSNQGHNFHWQIMACPDHVSSDLPSIMTHDWIAGLQHIASVSLLANLWSTKIAF